MDEMNGAGGAETVDELHAVQQLLTRQPPPSPNVVASARATLERAAAAQAHGSRAASQRRGWAAAGRRHWAGWLAPAAAAAAVVAVVAASLTVSSAFHGHALSGHGRARSASGSHPARSAPNGQSALASVPPYFLTFADPGFPNGRHAEIHSTATGAMLGSVTAPGGTTFTDASAAADDRTFVLAVRGGTLAAPAPARMYLLRLDGSGRPGPLTRLPVPPVAGYINGFALSPHASKLAVSILPAGANSSEVLVYSLPTGTRRSWTWPGGGYVGWNKPDPQSLSWGSDNRTLLYQERTQTGTGRQLAQTIRTYLLDTSAAGGDLRRASTRVPLPNRDIQGIVTGDGSAIVAPTAATTVHGGPRTQRQRLRMFKLLQKMGLLQKTIRRDRKRHAPAAVIQAAQRRLRQVQATYRKDGFDVQVTSVLTITDFSVRTGQPIRVLGRQRIAGEAGPGVEWTDPTGAVVIADHVETGKRPGDFRLVMGVYTSGAFTPLPPADQSLLYNRPIW